MSDRYNRYKPKVNAKDKKKALIVLAVLAVAVTAGIFLVKKWENDTYKTAGGASNVYVEPVITQPQTKEYNGEKYVQKTKIETYVLMGTDDASTASAAAGLNDANRNDLNLVIVINNEDNTWRMLQLNRDAMVLMPTLAADGTMYGSITAQLSLAHTYGDGLEMSCKNVTDTISNLLWNQQVDGYISLNMGGIGAMNDAVGGVTITVTDEISDEFEQWSTGDTVTLTGDEAETLLRERSMDMVGNANRMVRQRVYMDAFLKKLGNMSDEDITKVYDTISKYTVTDMGSGIIVALADKVKNYTQQDLVTIDGEFSDMEDWNNGNLAQENRLVVYTMNEDSVASAILELFYDKKS